jgi:hypothetical protein
MVAALQVVVCEISSSQGGEYEAQNLLGCTAVFLIECRPTFQRCVLLHHQGDDDLSRESYSVSNCVWLRNLKKGETKTRFGL